MDQSNLEVQLTNAFLGSHTDRGCNSHTASVATFAAVSCHPYLESRTIAGRLGYARSTGADDGAEGLDLTRISPRFTRADLFFVHPMFNDFAAHHSVQVKHRNILARRVTLSIDDHEIAQSK